MERAKGKGPIPELQDTLIRISWRGEERGKQTLKECPVSWWGEKKSDVFSRETREKCVSRDWRE